MTRLAVILLLISLPSWAQSPAENLLVRARTAYDQLLTRSESDDVSLDERLSLQLRIGRYDPSSEDAQKFNRDDMTSSNWLRLEYLLDHYEFAEIPELPVLRLRISDTPKSLALRFRWLFIQEDLEAIEHATKDVKSESDPVRLGARAEFLLKTLQFDSALTVGGWAVSAAHNPDERSAAMVTYAKTLYKLNRFQPALDTLISLFTPDLLNAEVLAQTANVLIKVGRTNDAIDLLEEAIRWNQWHEFAQYYLGNGYARLNYAQLEDSSGDKLAEAAALAREGSRAWSERAYDLAVTKFQASLAVLPQYGRAHNGLAKALEGKRMMVNVNRKSDEQKFEALAFPDVPQIENYILNWKDLSPRHQKQVALACEPWKKYLPLLVECGSHHYIKPLHEKLSECPNLITLRDKRVGYDTRLWDDVRGCGGFTTVTGIEDVERSIYFNYNTVLHELTHQVHGCFPSTDTRGLDNLWEAARVRDDGGTPTFMSRYQASSVWEYFAEGANAYFSPRRNPYDTREIVRERLFAMDTALVNIVEYYVNAPNLESCWPVGLINASDDRLEYGDLARASFFAAEARDHAPHSEVVLSALAHLHSLRNEDSLARSFADSLVKFFPERARSYSRLAEVVYMSKPNCDSDLVALLALGLMTTDTADKDEMLKSLANAQLDAGMYDEARTTYSTVLENQPTDYTALWGMANAMRTESSADSFYLLALAERTGLAALRCDYAEYLIKQDRLSDAETQIKEAQLIDPQDAVVLATAGYFAQSKGDHESAITEFDKSLGKPVAPRIAAVRKAISLRKLGRNPEATAVATKLKVESTSIPPEWVYDPEQFGYVVAGAWDAEARSELNEFIDSE